MNQQLTLAIKQLADTISARTELSALWASSILTVMVAGVAAYWGARLKKKGELDAQNANLMAIKNQLAETTRITESIRHQVDMQSWHHKEVATLRRSKAEAALEALNVTEITFSNWWGAVVCGREAAHPSHEIARSEMLLRLYFPNLRQAALAYAEFLREDARYAYEVGQQLLQTNNPQERDPIIQLALAQHSSRYPQRIRLHGALEEGIAREMAELIAALPPDRDSAVR